MNCYTLANQANNLSDTDDLFFLSVFQLMYELKGHEGFVNSIAFSPDKIFMYSGDSEGRIIVWKSAGKPY